MPGKERNELVSRVVRALNLLSVEEMEEKGYRPESFLSGVEDYKRAQEEAQRRGETYLEGLIADRPEIEQQLEDSLEVIEQAAPDFRDYLIFRYLL